MRCSVGNFSAWSVVARGAGICQDRCASKLAQPAAYLAWYACGPDGHEADVFLNVRAICSSEFRQERASYNVARRIDDQVATNPA